MIYLETESRRLAREAASRVGVTATQLNVLKLLEEIGELSLSELSKRLAAQNSTVTGIVDRMVQAGLVLREQSADDRRGGRIQPTHRRKLVAQQAEGPPRGLLKNALAALRDKEKGELARSLQKGAPHVARQVEKAR